MRSRTVSESSTHRPNAIVVGLDCITGLQTARALHQHGVRVTEIAFDRSHFATRTRLAAQVVFARRGSANLIECLRTLVSGDRPVLMPAIDTAVLIIAQHGAELATRFRIANPTGHSIERALGKAPFARHAEKNGIPIPQTRTIESLDGIRRASRDLSAPFVLLAYRSLAGLAISPAPLARFPNARWVCLKRDLAAAIAAWRLGELGLTAYLRCAPDRASTPGGIEEAIAVAQDRLDPPDLPCADTRRIAGCRRVPRADVRENLGHEGEIEALDDLAVGFFFRLGKRGAALVPLRCYSRSTRSKRTVSSPRRSERSPSNVFA